MRVMQPDLFEGAGTVAVSQKKEWLEILTDFEHRNRFTIDFGDEIGVRHSSGQYTHYTREELMGRQIIAVVNLSPRNIAGFMSECLILGVPTEDGKAAMLSPTIPAQIGGKLF